MERHAPEAEEAMQAAYWLYGLKSGVLAEAGAKEWAFSVIERSDNPAIEVIEVASAARREDVLENLATLAEPANLSAAGARLMAVLAEQLSEEQISLRQVIRAGLHIARATALPQNVYWEFDALDDELHLAESGTWGTVSEVQGRTVQALTKASGTAGGT